MKPTTEIARDFERAIRALCDRPGLDSTCIEPLGLYAEMIRRYGRRFNLVGSTSLGFIENDLILGSLEILTVRVPSGHLVDVGSGAGLPGIPLALAVTGLEVTLVEVRQKKVAFLRRVLDELHLQTVSIVDRPIEEWSGAPFDWAVARAFKPLEEWLELGQKLVGEGGHVGAYTTEQDWALAAIPSGLSPVGVAPDRTQPRRVVAVLVRGRPPLIV